MGNPSLNFWTKINTLFKLKAIWNQRTHFFVKFLLMTQIITWVLFYFESLFRFSKFMQIPRRKKQFFRVMVIGNPRKALTLLPLTSTLFIKTLQGSHSFPLSFDQKISKSKQSNSPIMKKKKILSLVICFLFLMSPLSHSLSHALQGIYTYFPCNSYNIVPVPVPDFIRYFFWNLCRCHCRTSNTCCKRRAF